MSSVDKKRNKNYNKKTAEELWIMELESPCSHTQKHQTNTLKLVSVHVIPLSQLYSCIYQQLQTLLFHATYLCTHSIKLMIINDELRLIQRQPWPTERHIHSISWRDWLNLSSKPSESKKQVLTITHLIYYTQFNKQNKFLVYSKRN
jgi:hypothetical protein